MTIININCCPISTQQPLSSSTPAPTSTTTPTPTVTPTITPSRSITPFAPGANSANFNRCADWNGQDGNVTTVGSNGGPSVYGTYDQSGNVSELNDLDGNPGSSRGLRGGSWNFSNPLFLSSSNRTSAFPADNRGDSIGFRLASSSSILNPLNLPYFVSVGNVNNAADTGGVGPANRGVVGYIYQIAQYPVTNYEYVEFLNAVAADDMNLLYSQFMASDPRAGISKSGSSGSFLYTVKNNMGNKPVIYVDWFDCARYCNWLHNGKPSGSQNSSTTENGAYTLNGAVSGNAVAKNAGAKYHIPTENEWYKAAYYKGGGTNAGYWKYATQSDDDPVCVNADSFGNGIYV